MEKKSRQFYTEKATETEQQSQRETFLTMADEEERHYVVLENIINFLSQPST
ncbi:MAG: hypothetical protein E3K29_09440 [Candidatus Brocadia sp.]|nr:hypothetical protein [Candidatus Brocadia sp.]OQZ01214.1 MAG: hypothetical protein B6D34_14050 [Candidatus Brocadia sp. UTAMX1]